MPSHESPFRRGRFCLEDLCQALALAGRADETGSGNLLITLSLPDREVEIVCSPESADKLSPSEPGIYSAVTSLPHLDDLVQEYFEAIWNEQRSDTGYWLFNLGWIELLENELNLIYWGNTVNTEWVAEFRWREARWQACRFNGRLV